MNDYRNGAGAGGVTDLVRSGAIFGLGYYICGVVGTVLSVPPADFAIVWPATALILAAFLLTAPRDWWIYCVGVLVAHFLMLWSVQSTPIRIEVALTQIAGNLGIAAASAAILLRAEHGPPRFDTFRSLFLFVLIAAVIVPLVGNGIVLSIHVRTGWAQDFWLSWRQWAVAGVYPTVTVTPLVVLAVQNRMLPRGSRLALAEVAVTCVAVFGVSLFVFGQHARTEYWPTLLLLPLPFLMWSAIRQGVGGTCLALLAFGAAIIVQALGGAGPFAEDASIEGVVSLQVFLTAIAVPLVLFAALMEEAKRTGELLRRSEARMEFAAASTETGLWQMDQRKQQFWMTEHCRTMFDLAPDETLTPDSFLRAIHSDDRPRVMKAWSAALTGGRADESIEFRIQRGEDDMRWMVARTYPERDASGAVIRLSGILHDVTQRVAAQQDVERLTQRLLTLQDDERKSIALELHDSTAQHLAACRLHLAALRLRIKPAADVTSIIDVIQSSLNEATNEIRSFTYLLRPPELEGIGLCEALAHYLEGFGRRTGLEVILDASSSSDLLPIEKKHAMYRIVQESLANVHRHAAATRVTVKLRHKGFSLHLFVIDDGRGLRGDGATATNSLPLGVGIPGMAARVRQLGGRFALRSSATGTRVHVALPVNLMAFAPQWQDAAA